MTIETLLHYCTAIGQLNAAKDELCAAADYEAAAEVRAIAERLRKLSVGAATIGEMTDPKRVGGWKVTPPEQEPKDQP